MAAVPVTRGPVALFQDLLESGELPHAVDDRCTCMGGFWSGSVDHGCTAWVAQMMYDYCRYSGDLAFLRETAYPFMVGAMRVYEEMLDRDGDAWVLPVGVSPEYRGSAIDAWGKNASFQLACIHWLCEHLIEAADALGEPPRAVWREIQRGLPRAAVDASTGREQIALWEGTTLEESHRHHSHLAGICPFDVLDLDDPDWRHIYANSLRAWVYRGMGMWSGWCVPWAAMIHTRFGNPEMAELLLEIWERVFTNEGHGTLHDAAFPGFTLIGAPSLIVADHGPRAPERMQMDAGMSATAAIMEMMLHTQRGVDVLFAGAPPAWQRVDFDGLRTGGAFLVGAERVDGQVTAVTVHSQAGGTYCLRNPWGEGEVEVAHASGARERVGGRVLRIPIAAGASVRICAAT